MLVMLDVPFAFLAFPNTNLHGGWVVDVSACSSQNCNGASDAALKPFAFQQFSVRQVT